MTLRIQSSLEQRSPDWYEQRRGIVTASAVGRLLTVRKLGAMDFACPACEAPALAACRSKVKRAGEVGADIKTPHPERVAVAARNKATVIEPASNEESRGLTHLLVAERVGGFVDPTYINADMWRGIDDEPRAVDLYGERFEPVQTCGFMTEDRWGFTIGFSPDGLVREDGLIEVKSRRGKGHVQTVLNGGVPIEHMAQLQCGLLVSGRSWADYVSYAGGFHLYVTRVRPDERWQKAIVEAVRQFENNAAEQAAQYMEAVDGMPLAERQDVVVI